MDGEAGLNYLEHGDGKRGRADFKKWNEPLRFLAGIYTSRQVTVSPPHGRASWQPSDRMARAAGARKCLSTPPQAGGSLPLDPSRGATSVQQGSGLGQRSCSNFGSCLTEASAGWVREGRNRVGGCRRRTVALGWWMEGQRAFEHVSSHRVRRPRTGESLSGKGLGIGRPTSFPPTSSGPQWDCEGLRGWQGPCLPVSQNLLARSSEGLPASDRARPC